MVEPNMGTQDMAGRADPGGAARIPMGQWVLTWWVLLGEGGVFSWLCKCHLLP